MDEKRIGAGHDVLLAKPIKVQGVQKGTLKEFCPIYVNANRDIGWPFKGPDALSEFLMGVFAAGLELLACGAWFKQHSGINPNFGLCMEFMVHFSVVSNLICVDQVNVLNCAGAELIARRLLMIMRAVRKDPKAPDFEGCDAYLSSAADASGGIITQEFDQYIVGLNAVEVTVLKQTRLLREEATAGKKAKGKDKPDA